jgi:hypothetical protein
MSLLVPARRPLRDPPGGPGGRVTPLVGPALSCPGRRPCAALPLAAVAAGALMLSAGCSAGQATVALPRKPSATSAAAKAAPPPLTPRQQVIAAYTAYTLALPAAESTQSAARARAMMAPYLSPTAIAALLRAFRAVWKKGEVSYGAPATHVVRVTVTGRTAIVDDCSNDSHTGLEDARTGQPVTPAGPSRVNLVTRLTQVHGRWLIGLQNVLLVPCTP